MIKTALQPTLQYKKKYVQVQISHQVCPGSFIPNFSNYFDNSLYIITKMIADLTLDNFCVPFGICLGLSVVCNRQDFYLKLSKFIITHKKHTHKPHTFLLIPPNTPIIPFHTKKIIKFIITHKKHTQKPENTPITPILF